MSYVNVTIVNLPEKVCGGGMLSAAASWTNFVSRVAGALFGAFAAVYLSGDLCEMQALATTNCAFVPPTDWLAQVPHVEVGTW